MLSTLAILFPNQQIICTLMSLAFAGLQEGLLLRFVVSIASNLGIL